MSWARSEVCGRDLGVFGGDFDVVLSPQREGRGGGGGGGGGRGGGGVFWRSSMSWGIVTCCLRGVLSPYF